MQALAAVLARADAPWLVSLEGIGGIGKTALAVALQRQLGRNLYFGDFAWVSAQVVLLDAHGAIRTKEQPALSQVALVTALLQQLASQEAVGLLGQPEAALNLLRQVLRRRPHLVVIDNLETIVDLEALLPALRTLVNPSKFVLTSRKRLIGEKDIYLYPVPELGEAESLALVRQAGAQHNVAGLAAASDADLRPLYAAVGGNPLALLLVVGQLHLSDLPTVLADLQEVARCADRESLHLYLPSGMGQPGRAAAAGALVDVAGERAWGQPGVCGRHRRTAAAGRRRCLAAADHIEPRLSGWRRARPPLRHPQPHAQLSS